MDSKIVASFAEAVADIPSGATLMVGGFGPGIPFGLLTALFDSGQDQLTVISNSANSPPRDGVKTIGDLIAARRVKKIVASFTAPPHPSRESALVQLHESGQIEAELNPQGTLAERIRAGGAGIPAFYTPTGFGTEMAEGKEVRVFNGRPYLLQEALNADYALVRAWKADEFGNLVFRRAQRNYNPIMAMASDFTIAEVEEIVPLGELDPDLIHTSGIFVHRVVAIPGGAQ